MNNVIKVLEIIVPIFATIFLGGFAKRTNKISEEAVAGLQTFVMSFCLPCVLFNSCVSASFGMESITSMALILPLIFLSSMWSYKIGRKKYPYHNLPQLFSAQESGMLGIPLFMTLFGADQAYRIGVLDLAQAVVCIPTIAILSTNTGKNPSTGEIIKKVFQSPLLIMSLLGLVMNVSGIMNLLNSVGIGGILTETTGFLAQPVSAAILFCVGYNFSLSKDNRKHVFEICGLHILFFSIICLIIQGILCFVPSVDAQARWAILLFCSLPGSYLATGLGRTKEEITISANVCSILTVVCLIIFCVIAVLSA